MAKNKALRPEGRPCDRSFRWICKVTKAASDRARASCTEVIVGMAMYNMHVRKMVKHRQAWEERFYSGHDGDGLEEFDPDDASSVEELQSDDWRTTW